MSETSSHLSLPFILPNQAQKHVTHNEAVQTLDAVVQLRIDADEVNTPPEDVAAGYRVSVGQAPIGVFAGQAGRIALLQDNAWLFLTPQQGWLAWFVETQKISVFDGAAWRDLSDFASANIDFGNLESLGVNAQTDPVNRLAVAAKGSLFTHDGTDHRLSLNKAAEGDTASILFQTNFDTFGEVGLIGDQSLCAKVSADGENWQTAWCAEPETGILQMPAARSGKISIAADAIAEVPTPSSGGFFLVMLVSDSFARADYSGIFAFDSGLSPALFSMALGPRAASLNNTGLTGETGPEASLNVAVKNGAIILENRFNGTRTFMYMFIG